MAGSQALSQGPGLAPAWVPSPSSPVSVCLSAETCPQLAVPANGRKLGRSARVGHDVHFVCDAGFRLVGSETRTCRRDRTWGGTQPSCRSEVARARGRLLHRPAPGHGTVPGAAQRPPRWAPGLRPGRAGGQEGAGISFSSSPALVSWYLSAPSPQVLMTVPATHVQTAGPAWMATRATRACAHGVGREPAARAPSTPVGALRPILSSTGAQIRAAPYIPSFPGGDTTSSPQTG